MCLLFTVVIMMIIETHNTRQKLHYSVVVLFGDRSFSSAERHREYIFKIKASKHVSFAVVVTSSLCSECIQSVTNACGRILIPSKYCYTFHLPATSCRLCKRSCSYCRYANAYVYSNTCIGRYYIFSIFAVSNIHF